MTYTYQHFYVMLATALLDRGFAQQMTDLIKGNHIIAAGGRTDQGLILEAIREHLAAHNAPPDLGWLQAHLESRLDGLMPDPASREACLKGLETFSRFAPKVTKASRGECELFLQHIVETTILGPQRADIIQSAMFDSSGSKAREIIEKLQTIDKESHRGTDNGIAVDLFSVPEDLSGRRRKTGLPWLDSRLGNGLGPVSGCLIGILAPSGGGKTTLGNETAITGALAGQHTVLAMAEEGLTFTVKTRLLSRTTGIPSQMLEQIDFGDIKEVCNMGAQLGLDPDAIAHRITMVRKYLHVIDLVAVDGGLEEITRGVDTIAFDAGEMPRLIYVDWAGHIADRIMSTGFKGRTFEKKHEAILAVVSFCADLATTTNQQVALSQQMLPAAAEGDPTKPTTMYDAADCKMFCGLTKYMINLGGRCKRSAVQLAAITKARDDKAGQTFPLLLDGTTGTFQDVGNLYRPRSKYYVPITKDNNAVPSARPKPTLDTE